MIQNDRLFSILDHLREAGRHLETKQSLTRTEFLQDWEQEDIVERELEKAVQSCIDCGTRIIAEKGWERAEDNHEVFDILAKHGVIPAKLAQEIKELVGLRHILAHEYRHVRAEEVYRHLQNCPPIFWAFARAIAEQLS